MGLLEHVDRIADPRKQRGLRHPVNGLIKAVILSLLSGMSCVEHIYKYVKEHWEELAEELGFTHWHCPCGNTFRRILTQLDSNTLSQVFESWMGEVLMGKTLTVSIDGKSCRGVQEDGKKKGKALHVLNVFAQDVQVVLSQYPLEDKKGESTVAKDKLKDLVHQYPGIALFTLDAGLSGRNLCETILSFEKDYLVRIKGNQPELSEALSLWFIERLKENSKADAKIVEKRGKK